MKSTPAGLILAGLLTLPSAGAWATNGMADFSQPGSKPSSVTGVTAVTGTAAASPSKSPVPAATAQATAVPSGEPTPSAGAWQAYRKAERAGGILDEEDAGSLGKVAPGPDGGLLFGKGQSVSLLLDQDVSAKPGDEFLAVREMGQVREPSSKRILGVLVKSVGVVKVVSVDGRRVETRVMTTYEPLEPGDKIRSRAREAALYARSLQGGMKIESGLEGSIVAARDKVMAAQGELVYLDLGRNQGVRPGMRFRGPEGSLLEAVLVRARSCAARVLAASQPLHPGDKVKPKG